MKVKNLNGTADNTCKCASWIDHWKKFSSQPTPTICVVTGCNEKTEVGAHIQKDVATDNSWYIIPICKKCNGKKGQDLIISDTTRLVSANVKETCGK
jgi:hypothetical protein